MKLVFRGSLAENLNYELFARQFYLWLIELTAAADLVGQRRGHRFEQDYPKRSRSRTADYDCHVLSYPKPRIGPGTK